MYHDEEIAYLKMTPEQKKLEYAISAACLEAYPPDVDQVDYDGEAMREILQDANEPQRNIFEEGMREVLDNPEKYGLTKFCL